MDSRAASLPEEGGDHGERPAGVHHVVHQQAGTCRHCIRAENAVKIPDLHAAVLHGLLRAVGAELAHAGKEGQPKSMGKAPGKIRHQIRMCQGRNAGDPLRRRGGISVPVHDGAGIDKLLVKGARAVFSFPHKRSPAFVSIQAKGASAFRLKFVRNLILFKGVGGENAGIGPNFARCMTSSLPSCSRMPRNAAELLLSAFFR